jgi:hypothetical protein
LDGATANDDGGADLDGGADADSGADGAVESPCALHPGFYFIHYTKDPGSATCADIADQTAPIFPSDAGSSGPAPGCTSTQNSCTVTQDCTQLVDGWTVTSEQLFTPIQHESASGSLHTHYVRSSDGFVLDCYWTYTWTKT